jgi:hypothetical protein
MSARARMCFVMNWASVYGHLLQQPSGAVFRVAKWALPDPRAHGAVPSIGWPAGQSADLRFPPDAACRGLHVHEFVDRWEAHLDRVHPDCDLVEHLRRDAPRALYATTTSAGALIGGFASKTLVGAFFGGGVGLVVGLVVHALGRR